jgi:hypothetical protein
MEAIYFGDLLANEDPEDAIGHVSSLDPPPDPTICPGDCVSGRHNENHADGSFVGGDPVIRVGRFGLRGTGPTLLQFVVGGTQGEIGLTSPFFPTEQNNVEIADKGCDIVPDPELKAETVLDLRSLIRMLGIPDYAPELLQNPPTGQLAMDVQAGAALFGVDMDAFRSRVTEGATPTNFGDPDADHAIAKDRQLNCVGCHIPIMKTGESPAAYGGEILSNRWAPIFSDLLIHKMTSYPAVRYDHIVPPPPPGIDRNLADFAVPPSVTGLAGGDEWRTPPLMGIGKTGAPFLHDARVFLNTAAPTSTLYTNSQTTNDTLVIDTLDSAVQAAIEMHDLPVPPGGDETSCPQVMSAQMDICSRRSPNRSEARNTIERWHRLTPQQQLQVIKFVESL